MIYVTGIDAITLLEIDGPFSVRFQKLQFMWTSQDAYDESGPESVGGLIDSGHQVQYRGSREFPRLGAVHYNDEQQIQCTCKQHWTNTAGYLNEYMAVT